MTFPPHMYNLSIRGIDIYEGGHISKRTLEFSIHLINIICGISPSFTPW